MGGRALVTGAGGFLGSHICQHLGQQNFEVCALGRFSADLPCSLDVYPNIWKFCGMTLPDSRLEDTIREFNPELIVHCAGTASVAESVAEPYRDFQRTVEVCAFTLETSRRFAPDASFILCSSASVYGNPKGLPIDESAGRLPISPYGYHKAICELLAEEYLKLHGVRCSVLRIFSAYGERLFKQVVYDITKKCFGPEPSIELYGTGAESRDFIHGRDVARAVEIVHKAGKPGVYNVAGGRQTTILEIASTIVEAAGVSKPLEFGGQQREGDPLNWEANISKLEGVGYVPSISIESGIQGYINWFKEFHGV